MEFLWTHIDIIGITVLLVSFSFFEDPLGLFGPAKRTLRDNIIEQGGLALLTLVVKPATVFVSALLAQQIIPDHTLVFASSPLWVGLILYILIDDFLQYWWHRLSHVSPLLWNLHRAHHSATSMGAFVSYRNDFFYFLFMPNLWATGVLLYLGFGQGAAVGLLLKMIVVVSSHSQLKWDKFLYDRPALHPLAWIIERTIVTPATHYAHHGKCDSDGISNSNGNFSNMLFIWDLIFRTGKITRKYPEIFGIMKPANDSWQSEMFWPFVTSNDPDSELAQRTAPVRKTI